MAITADTTVNRVAVRCNCDGMNASYITPYDGTTRAVDFKDIDVETTDADDLAQLAIMQDKIDSGDADLWYRDGNTWIEYEDLADVHGLIHAMHPMRPANRQDGGHNVLPNIVKSTGYSKDDDTGRSDLTTQFGVIPTKRTPDGSDLRLARWTTGTHVS